MAKIFVADRDAGSRKGLAHALRQRGIEVEEFQNGPALYACALTEDPDLIVLDTDLEEMDGFQVFARLQRKRPEKPFPLLFVTDFDHPRVSRICRERGAVGYVAKSRPLEQILDAVLDAIDRPQPLAGRSLAAALAWLQSRGKTGRLDVEANGHSGYVLLHKGRLLDAEWGSWRGEEVLKVFAEGIPAVGYRFAEGIDDLERPAPAVEAVIEGLSSRADPSPARPLEESRAAGPRPATPVAERPAPSEPSARTPRRPRSPVRGPALGPLAPAAPSGALAALQELQQARRARRLSGRTRRALAAAAVAALVVTVSVGIAALYSGPLPAPVRQVLTLIRVGEGGTVASVPRPQPRVSDTPPGASPVAQVAPPAEPGTGVVAAGRPVEGTAGRFDVTPSNSAASYGSSFGPGSQPRAAEPVSVPAARREEPRPAPPSATRQESPTAPSAAASEAPHPAPSAREPRHVPEAASPDRPAGADARDCPEDWTEAFCLGAAAGSGGAGIQPVPAGTPTPSAPGPDEEPAPAPPRASAAPAPAPPAVAPRPSASVSEPVEARPVPPARTGTPLLQKPILLKRGEGLYYPPELKAQGVGGNVVLNIRVGENGRAQQVEVAKSSGYDAFDQAAVAAVGTFLWEPARDADGPAEAWITQAVTFRP